MFASQDMFKGEEVEEEWSASDDETAESPVVPTQVQAFANPTMGMASNLSPSISLESPEKQDSPVEPCAPSGFQMSMGGPSFQSTPKPLEPSIMTNETPQPLARPLSASGGANNFKDRMSRMQALQERKRAERTGSSGLVSKSSGLASTPVANSSVPGVEFSTQVHETARHSENPNTPAPVTQTELNIASQGMDMVFDPTKGSDTTAPIAQRQQAGDADDDSSAVVKLGGPEHRKRFITSPWTSGGVVQCQIIRHKSMLFNSFPSYELYLKDGMRFVMAARKRKKTKGAYYIMSTNKDNISRHDENFVGKTRSNVLGTEFGIYDSGYSLDDKEKVKGGSGELKKELGFVTYESNLLGAKGPRKMTVALPSVDSTGQPALFTHTGEQNGLEAAMGEGDVANEVKKNVYCLVNRAPKWSERVAAYTLDFKGRVTMASVKNFQLVENQEDDRIVLQFGKTGVDEFTMDFRAPLSPLQALGICLSSLDNKWACE